MDIISIVAISVIFGVAFSLDLILTKKGGGYIVRNLVSIFALLSAPNLMKKIFGEEEKNYTNLWNDYFYIVLVIIIALSFLIVYFSVYRPIITESNFNKLKRRFTFLDFIENGYANFKKEIESTQQEYDDKKIDSLKINDKIRTELISFVAQTYQLAGKHSDNNAYITYVLTSFIDKFLGHCDARFTLRKLDAETGKMKALITTGNDSIPGDIDMKKPNMIKESIKKNRAVIYSENIRCHYKTSNNGISKGLYEDYVSCCLVQTDDKKSKPLYSICLDVKGDNAKQRMNAFVDTLIFDIICKAISIQLKKEHEK